MSNEEFPPEVIEASVIANIASGAVREFKVAHEEIVKFVEELQKSGMMSMAQFNHLMDNVLLTLIHGRDYIKLLSDKQVLPVMTDEAKAKYGPHKDRIIEIAFKDERIDRLKYIFNETLDEYDERGAREAAERADTALKEFIEQMKAKGDNAQTD